MPYLVGPEPAIRISTRLIVIGRIDAEQLPDLQYLVWSESAYDVVLDLMEVTLVNSEVVRFLVQCETKGLRSTPRELSGVHPGMDGPREWAAVMEVCE